MIARENKITMWREIERKKEELQQQKSTKNELQWKTRRKIEIKLWKNKNEHGENICDRFVI